MLPVELAREQPDKSALRTLTGEEQALYDRQIRLWGVEAQRKLASSSVLMVCDPASLLAQEIAKNVVLAGVARLVLHNGDVSTVATNGNRETKEKVRPGFLGLGGTAVVEALRAMNPLVDVSVTIDEPPLSEFCVVCVVAARLRDELAMAIQARKAGLPFMCGRVAGEVGWVFIDGGSPPNASYADCVAGPWGGEVSRGEFGWHVARTLLGYEDEHDTLPSAGDDDLQQIIQFYQSLCEQKKSTHVKNDVVMRAARAARFVLPPVASVVGGMWGRELIKIISARGEPLDGFNFFFFNAASSKGSVELVKSNVA